MVTAYGVWGKKRFLGREYMGTSRWSFLIDPEGKIAKIYDAVKPATHAEEVLADLNELMSSYGK
jgi:peroxiredoxin Q/BCP